MGPQMDLKELERKVWTSFYNDGMGDIFLGCLVLMFALAPIIGRLGLGDFWSSAVFVPFLTVLYILIVLIRKRVIVPRIGLVSFGQARTKRLMKFNILMLVVLSVSLILGVISVKGTTTQGWVHSLRFIVVLLICFGIAGYFLGFVRLYVYGILTALSIPVGEWLFSRFGVPHHGFPVTFGITSGIIVITGVVLFLRLLGRNPCLKET